MVGKNFRKLGRDLAGEQNAPLMEATLPGATLGGTGQLGSLGIQNISGNRLEKTGSVILLGLSGGQLAVDSGGTQGRGHSFMNGAIRRKGAGLR